MKPLLLEGIRLPRPAAAGEGGGDQVDDDQALLVDRGLIAAIGPADDVRAQADAGHPHVVRHTLDGALVTPGLIDAHTHLVWAGSRADEHAQRLTGTSYEAIARAGGGIRSTVRAVRAADDEALLRATVARARVLAAEGVTTVEIKSGYGLTVEDELRCLRVARRVAEHVPIHVVTTLLAAHAVPAEGDADAWVTTAVDELIPRAAAEGLADAVDVFCEGIGFSVPQCERVWAAAAAHGLAVKAHAEQLSNLSGARAAAAAGARSVDHLEHLDPADASALRDAGTVAMLLPLAWLHLGQGQRPPVAALRDAGVAMAVATDANPGSAPLLSLRLAAHTACHGFGLRPDEAWRGITEHAATALGLPDRGVLRAGAVADLAVWDAPGTAEIVCTVGTPILRARVVAGRWHEQRPPAGTA